MVYVPITFIDGSTPLTARNMSLLETQFSEAKLDIDVHLHEDLYYNKSLADARFFSLTHMGPGIGPDADLIDGKHYDELIGGLIPVGLGFGWNGTDADIPTNWHLSDGSTVNGIILPDARGLALMGAGSLHAARSTGGLTSLTTVGGTVNISGHVLTIAEIPVHYHDWVDHYDTNSQIGCYGGVSTLRANTTTSLLYTSYNHDAADEAHGAGTKVITLNPFSIIPLYFSKYLIIKVS